MHGFRLAIVTLAAALIAGTAGAEADQSKNSGWYAGVHVGAVVAGDIVDDSGTWSSNGTPYSYAASLSTDPGFGAGAVIGYKLPIGFRFELELTYRRNGLD